MKRKPQSPSLGEEIIASLTEFRDALAAGEPIRERFTVRTVAPELHPRAYDAPAVRRVREGLNVSQPLFAAYLGVSVQTVRAWEQGKKAPSPMARRFLDEIADDPERVRRRLREGLKSEA
jgi:putative transcriptional regulator